MSDKEYQIEFGKFVRKAREETGLYQWEVAKMLDVGQPYISHLERGERVVDLRFAQRLCKVIGANLNDFLDYIEKP